MRPLESHRFLFVTGKGGVGKTTVAAALAERFAAQGKRVLLTVCDAKERTSQLLGVPALTEELREVKPRLYAVKITAERAMEEYSLMILRSRAMYSAVFDNRFTRGFFKGVPGLYEWAMLGKAWYHSIEEQEGGAPRFDVVLFDAPATGHGLDMLRVPKIITEVVPPGILRRDAERAYTMFRDPKQSGVVVVTLPEDMPTSETLELYEALTNELGLPVARLVINGVIEPLFSPEEQQELLRDRTLNRSLPGDEALSGGIRRVIRERVQEESLARLAALPVERTELPLLLKEAQAPEAVQELAALLR